MDAVGALPVRELSTADCSTFTNLLIPSLQSGRPPALLMHDGLRTWFGTVVSLGVAVQGIPNLPLCLVPLPLLVDVMSQKIT